MTAIIIADPCHHMRTGEPVSFSVKQIKSGARLVLTDDSTDAKRIDIFAVQV